MRTRKATLDELKEKQVIIDAHSHSGGIDMYAFQHDCSHMTQNMRDLSKKMKEAEIDYFIVFPLASAIYFDTRKFTKSGLEDWPYQLNNRALFYELNFSGENALPFAIMNPSIDVKEQISYLETLTKKEMIFGLKFHPRASHESITKLRNSPMLDFMREHKLPMTIHSDFHHTNYSNPLQIFPLLDENPDLKFCIAHSGYFNKEFLTNAIQYANLFIDCSPFNAMCATFSALKPSSKIVNLNFSNPSDALLELYKLIPKQLLWGSDEPWSSINDISRKTQFGGDLLLAKKTLDTAPSEIKYQIAYVNTLKYLE
jgi:predicted TIM-barrel fold metal-dependent hydrolase